MKKKVSIAAGFLASLLIPATVFAASTVVVLPSDANWSTADTRANGHVSFVNDSTSPLGAGALRLETDTVPAASQDKAQYLTTNHVGTPLANVTDLSYWTKQNASHGGFAAGLPSYQLEIDADGVVDSVGNTGFTTMVYEPYNNFGNAAVHNDEWQQWDVDAGTMWSSRPVAELTPGQGGLSAGFGGAPFYSLADLQAKYPNAIVLRIGVNIGSNNPDYDTEADGVVFNGTTYDFDPSMKPSSKDDCKKDGWKNFNDPAFKNQGDCVSYMTSHGKKGGVFGWLSSVF